jgi:hypothetical protein
MTKTSKIITFSTYHVNICTDMGYISMMTKQKISVLITLAVGA